MKIRRTDVLFPPSLTRLLPNLTMSKTAGVLCDRNWFTFDNILGWGTSLFPIFSVFYVICVFLFCSSSLSVLWTTLPLSLHCPFLIVPSDFTDIYFNNISAISFHWCWKSEYQVKTTDLAAESNWQTIKHKDISSTPNDTQMETDS